MGNYFFIGGSQPEKAYPNEDAHLELKRIMSKHERINIRLRTDQEGYPYVWIETQTVDGFKYRINPEGLNWIMNYLSLGKTEDLDVKPSEVEKYSGIEDIQLNICKQLIESGKSIKFIPLFRNKDGYIRATTLYPHGKLFFTMMHTEELEKYLREKNLI